MRDLRHARSQREAYAKKVFGLVAWWIAGVFALLLLQGYGPRWRPFSDKVLIALVTSMTANLIGTLVIVLKFIFHVPEQPPQLPHS